MQEATACRGHRRPHLSIARLTTAMADFRYAGMDNLPADLSEKPGILSWRTDLAGCWKTTAETVCGVARCSHPRLSMWYVSGAALRAPCIRPSSWRFSTAC